MYILQLHELLGRLIAEGKGTYDVYITAALPYDLKLTGDCKTHEADKSIDLYAREYEPDD